MAGPKYCAARRTAAGPLPASITDGSHVRIPVPFRNADSARLRDSSNWMTTAHRWTSTGCPQFCTIRFAACRSGWAGRPKVRAGRHRWPRGAGCHLVDDPRTAAARARRTTGLSQPAAGGVRRLESPPRRTVISRGSCSFGRIGTLPFLACSKRRRGGRHGRAFRVAGGVHSTLTGAARTLDDPGSRSRQLPGWRASRRRLARPGRPGRACADRQRRDGLGQSVSVIEVQPPLPGLGEHHSSGKRTPAPAPGMCRSGGPPIP